MTRDEAIKIWQDEVTSKERVGIAADSIRGFVALGMLKLDKPKSADDLLAEAVGTSFAFDTNEMEMKAFRHELGLRGLKIIEA